MFGLFGKAKTAKGRMSTFALGAIPQGALRFRSWITCLWSCRELADSVSPLTTLQDTRVIHVNLYAKGACSRFSSLPYRARASYFELKSGTMQWYEDEDFWREMYPYLFPPEKFSAAEEQVSQILTLAALNEGSVLDLSKGWFSFVWVFGGEFFLFQTRRFCAALRPQCGF